MPKKKSRLVVATTKECLAILNRISSIVESKFIVINTKAENLLIITEPIEVTPYIIIQNIEDIVFNIIKMNSENRKILRNIHTYIYFLIEYFIISTDYNI